MQNRASSDLINLINMLAKDADACEAEIARTASGLAKRNFARALFAWIEAISYLMRQHVLSELQEKPLTEQSIPKIIAASEKTYRVDDKGNVAEHRLGTKTSHNLLFSLRSFAEYVGLPLVVDRGGRTWQTYSQALKIRDRVTHPKTAGDLKLTEADIDTLRQAKAMIIVYIQVFSRPALIEHINEKRREAKTRGIGTVLKLTEEDLARFGIEGEGARDEA